MTRRETLRWMGNGFGSLALAETLCGAAAREPGAPQPPHFAPKAKRVIFLFLNGGMSQVDTFDPKPMLDKHHGEPMPGPKIVTDRASGNLMRSPFQFKQCGKSGLPVSEIFPKVGERIDDICVIRSCWSDNGNHGPSLLMMNCGHWLAGTSVDGFVAHLRSRLGEPEPAGLCRALSGLSGAGTAVVEFRVPARQLPGHVYSQRRAHAGKTGAEHPESALQPVQSRNANWRCSTR